MKVGRDHSEELKKIFSACKSADSSQSVRPKQPTQSTSTGEVKEFFRCAQSFAKDIADMSTTIYQIMDLNARKNIFEDTTSQVTLMTQEVKIKLQRLHQKLQQLEEMKQSAVNSQKNVSWDSSRKKTVEAHSDTVVESLKSKLAKSGQDFRSALQQQTQSMKSSSSRRSHFSVSDTPQTLEGALTQELDQYQQLTAGNLQYSHQRVEDMRQIEAAVTEVNEMFNDFTRLVREQEDVVIRIDTNVDDALRNVNAGSNELLRYLSHLTSNRGLILKVLGFLFLFLIFFGFVVVR